MVNSKTISIYDYGELVTWINVCIYEEVRYCVDQKDNYFLLTLTCSEEMLNDIQLKVERKKHVYCKL